MADPLSISSGIIAILQLTGVVVEYLNDVKGAAEDRRKILAEVTGATGILYMLKDSAEQAQSENRPLTAFTSLQVPRGPLEQFKGALEELTSRLGPADGTRKLGRVLAWPFHKSEIKEIIDRMERQKSSFAIALQNHQIGLSREINGSISHIEEDLHHIGHDLKRIRVSQSDQESRKILSWLSPLNFWAKQNDISEKRQGGTGNWVFDTPEFQGWINGTLERLWCPGAPGAGKTILTSLIVDHLDQSTSPDVGLAYAYCNYQDIEQSALNLTGCLLQQLVEQLPSIPNEVEDLYKRHLNRSTRPQLVEFSSSLKSAVSKFSKVFIIIDALDECSESTGVRYRFLDEIKTLQPNVHLLVTSRPIASIGYDLQPCQSLQISAHDEDIRLFLEDYIRRERRLRNYVMADSSLQDAIIVTIIEKAQGMFLLAQLHIALLARKQNRKEVRLALESLPKELHGTYDEAVQRIQSQSNEDADLAKRVISWVTCAFRLLTVSELQHALAVVPCDIQIDESAVIDADLLVSVCAGLITIEKENSIVCLVHYTALEYFLASRSRHFPNAHVDIAKACLTYLLFDIFAEGFDLGSEQWLSRMEAFPLKAYAAEYWGRHLSKASDQEAVKMALRFLTDQPRLLSVYESSSFWRDKYFPLSMRRFNGLHIAVSFGLSTVLKTLMVLPNVEVSLEDNVGRTPLSIAARNGDTASVKVLLSTGCIDIDAGCGTLCGTALHAAAGYGHVSLVEDFLARGAGIGSLTAKLHTPLHMAAEWGHLPVVQLLLKAGSDVKARTDSGTTALYRSIRSGSIDTLSLLIKQDGDVNVTTWDYWTPLHEAAECDQFGMVEQLIAAGGDLSVRTINGQTALDLAELLEREDIAKLLRMVQMEQNTNLHRSLALRPRTHETSPDINMRGHEQYLNEFNEKTRINRPRGDHCGYRIAVDRSVSRPGNPYSIPDSESTWRTNPGQISSPYKLYREDLLHRFPRLTPEMTDRLATEQSKRYTRLLSMRHEHHIAFSKYGHRCSVGSLCPKFDCTMNTSIREYSIISTDFGQDTNILPAPAISLPADFECPSCFEVIKILDLNMWVQHVHEDLRSFTCTIEDCPDPQSFERESDWVKHENKHHPTKWACNFPNCTVVKIRKDHILDHLFSIHKICFKRPGPISVFKGTVSSQIKESVVSNDGESYRPSEEVAVSGQNSQFILNCPSPEPCVFCGSMFSNWEEYYGHKAEHMRQISLSVLKVLE